MNGDSLDQFHGEVGVAFLGLPGFVESRNARVLEMGESLSFDFKATENLPGIDAGFEQLEGHLAPDQADLLGAVNNAESTFANFRLNLDALNLRQVGLLLRNVFLLAHRGVDQAPRAQSPGRTGLKGGGAEGAVGVRIGHAGESSLFFRHSVGIVSEKLKKPRGGA